jgi:hypothetical protein
MYREGAEEPLPYGIEMHACKREIALNPGGGILM